MRPLAECPDAELAELRGLLTDIDDTLTTDGRLTAAAYLAMEELQDAGIAVIPVTGRPAGWCDHIARMWPVAAVVGENGAFWFRYDRAARRMLRYFVRPADERRSQRERLGAIAARIVAAVPGACVAADQAFRESDLAIDFREDVPELPEASVQRIARLLQDHGLNVKVSSIHVNGWFGSHDKLSTCLALLESQFEEPAVTSKARYAFIGDSPNDAPMFEFFELSVGVANVQQFTDQIGTLPRFVTCSSHGLGFRELAHRLLHARRR